MELTNPRNCNHFTFFSMLVKSLYLTLVDMSLNIVAEVRKEENLTLAVPQKRML